MALIKCPDCGKEFSDSAVACPNCGRPHKQVQPVEVRQKTGCLAWGCLSVIVLGVIGTLATAGNSPTSSTPSFTGAAAPAAYQAPQLELLSWNWHTEYGYAIAEGRVKNISTESLRNVEASVTFSTKSGEFITTDDALIDLNPLLPGQTSSFKVMATRNPAMARARVEFKFLMGGTVPWRVREKVTKPSPSVSPAASARRARAKADSEAAHAERLRKMDSGIFGPIFGPRRHADSVRSP